MEGNYSIELFRDGGEGAGIEKILVRHDTLTVARALYKVAALNYHERLIMLCDRARVLARSDRPEEPIARSAFSMLRIPPSMYLSPFIVIGGQIPGMAVLAASARSNGAPEDASHI